MAQWKPVPGVDVVDCPDGFRRVTPHGLARREALMDAVAPQYPVMDLDPDLNPFDDVVGVEIALGENPRAGHWSVWVKQEFPGRTVAGHSLLVVPAPHMLPDHVRGAVAALVNKWLRPWARPDDPFRSVDWNETVTPRLTRLLSRWRRG